MRSKSLDLGQIAVEALFLVRRVTPTFKSRTVASFAFDAEEPGLVAPVHGTRSKLLRASRRRRFRMRVSRRRARSLRSSSRSTLLETSHGSEHVRYYKIKRDQLYIDAAQQPYLNFGGKV